MSKFGINGFGCIGCLVLCCLLEVDSSLEVVVINDFILLKVLVYLLKYDLNYGFFLWSVDFIEDVLIVNGKIIMVYVEKEVQYILWQVVGVEVIVECIGFYILVEKL